MRLRWLSAVLAVVAVLGLAAPAVSAAGVVFGDNPACSKAGGSAGCTNQAAGNPIVTILTKAIDFAALIGGIVATIFIVIGGFKYVLSDGNADKMESARSTIIYSIVGLFVIVIARTLIRFILGRVNP